MYYLYISITQVISTVEFILFIGRQDAQKLFKGQHRIRLRNGQQADNLV